MKLGLSSAIRFCDGRHIFDDINWLFISFAGGDQQKI